jgi:F-type H+-transporting ATPase subunit epsilon
MVDYRKQFHCDVLTPERQLCSVPSVSVVFPSSDGQVGILGGRAPMVARVGAGPLTVFLPDESRECYYIAGGFAQMREDRLTILAEECIPVANLSRDSAWSEIQKAKDRPAGTRDEIADRAEAIRIARVKFRLAQGDLEPEAAEPDWTS